MPTPTTKRELEQLLTGAEVLDLLRWKSRTTLHRARKSGLLPAVIIGGSVRFRAKDVERLINGRRG